MDLSQALTPRVRSVLEQLLKAIHQGSKPDLVSNPVGGQSLNEDTDHEAQHRGAAIEELNAFELIHVDLLPSLEI